MEFRRVLFRSKWPSEMFNGLPSNNPPLPKLPPSVNFPCRQIPRKPIGRPVACFGSVRHCQYLSVIGCEAEQMSISPGFLQPGFLVRGQVQQGDGIMVGKALTIYEGQAGAIDRKSKRLNSSHR